MGDWQSFRARFLQPVEHHFEHLIRIHLGQIAADEVHHRHRLSMLCERLHKVSRSRIPATRPFASTTGKSCCEPARISATTWDRLSRGESVLKSVSIARVTGIPLTVLLTCTAPASCDAPIQTKKAMKSRNGLLNKPMKPRTNAKPCPIVAATCVARTKSIRMASNARSTRPPSIGNAGIRLNKTSQMLTIINRSANEPEATVRAVNGTR